MAQTSEALDLAQRIEALSIKAPSSSSSPATPLSVQEALDYVDKVKRRFGHDRPDIYEGFLDTMKKLRSAELSTPEIVKRINVLFSGHIDLIIGFDGFLPPEYQYNYNTNVASSSRRRLEDVPENDKLSENGSGSSGTASPSHEYGKRSPTPTPESTSAQFDLESSVAYVKRVEESCDPEVWEQFMDLWSLYEQGIEIDEDEFVREVLELFEEYPDLIPGFKKVVTDKSKSKEKQRA